MAHKKRPPTPAGEALRKLREQSEQTQLDVELSARLGIGYLQRLELGKVTHPKLETLSRILDTLNASYSARRHILQLYGYQIEITEPTPTDIASVQANCADLFEQTPFPCYVLDYMLKVHLWNKSANNIFEFDTYQQSKSTVQMTDILFDASSSLYERIQNPDEFYQAQVRIFKYEQSISPDQTSYTDLIKRLKQYPHFCKYWLQISDEAVLIPSRPLCLMSIEIDNRLHHYRFTSESYGQDPRFRIMYLMPDISDRSQ